MLPGQDETYLEYMPPLTKCTLAIHVRSKTSFGCLVHLILTVCPLNDHKETSKSGRTS